MLKSRVFNPGSNHISEIFEKSEYLWRFSNEEKRNGQTRRQQNLEAYI